MSDAPLDDTWWMATDGKWYPPASHPSNWTDEATRPTTAPTPPPVPVPPTQPTATTPSSPAAEPQPAEPVADRYQVDPLLTKWRLGQGYSQLTSVLVGAAVLGIIAAGFGIGVAFVTNGSMDRFNQTAVGSPAEARAIADWESSENLLVNVNLATRGLWAVFAIISIFWLYRAYRTVVATGAPGRQWSPGWAIGGFLIPVMNLIVPFLIVSETAKVAATMRIAASTGTPEEISNWRRSPTNFLIVLWWLGFVGMIGLGVAFSASLSEALTGSFSNIDAEFIAFRQAYVLAGLALLSAALAFGSLARVAHEIRLNFRAASDGFDGASIAVTVAPGAAARPSPADTPDLTSTAGVWRAAQDRPPAPGAPSEDLTSTAGVWRASRRR